MCRLLVALALAACLGLAAGGGEARETRTVGGASLRGPFELVSLGSLGTVTWSCDGKTGRYALGYRLAGRWATTLVVLRAEGRVVRRITVQPGEAVSFPFLGDDTQRPVLVQGSGARTLRADVAAAFDHPLATYTSCQPYLPPALDVRMRPVG